MATLGTIAVKVQPHIDTTAPLDVRKQFDVAKFDTGTDDTTGRFEAIVSAFDVLDSQGDVIVRGAFAESIARFAAGHGLPVVWSHDYWDPDSIIGEVVEIEETDTGLKVAGVLDIADNPRAASIYRQMRLGRLKEFSIGGVVPDDSWEVVGKGETATVRIKRLDLWEVGPCFKGANPDTELLSVKARVAARATQDEPRPVPEPNPPAPSLSKAQAARLALLTTLNP